MAMLVSSMLLSLGLIAALLGDIFETMVGPRRVTRTFRLTRIFYRALWAVWHRIAIRFSNGKRREAFLSIFGPLSLFALFATWASGLIVGFGTLQWSLGARLSGVHDEAGLGDCLYLSGTTFFTLGYGDVSPMSTFGRILSVVESGLGFGYMAVVIGYLPVLYQAFSRREVTISLLDARSGSPPSAAQFLLRLARSRDTGSLAPLLTEWERWAAELLESHLSYPVLVFYRSQHDNQSWLAALTTILDTCSLILVGGRSHHAYQAQLTFAMARHAAVDLALVFRTAPIAPEIDRFPPARLALLRSQLHESGMELRNDAAVDAQLAELRELYEPFVNALAAYFLVRLPQVIPEKPGVDNWQTSAWTRRSPAFDKLSSPDLELDDHFD
ncbi:MAG: potassium channel family protein [Candidatus Acidiferrum sp.]